ncbi:MAG: di-heme oxidoredictase family protein [Burkholderiaceae bacterium]
MILGRSACLALAAALACGAASRVVADTAAGIEPPTLTLRARIVATGLLGAHGIRQVGRFHSGGPLTSNPEFLLQTQPGRVLDPERVLVALENNLGAALGNRAHAAGSVLSIDPRMAAGGRPIAVPENLAVLPQREEGGPLQIYTAQTEAHMNGSHNGGARTAGFTAASGPRYLSINNAFGRPWIANAPFGLRGEGSESVVDPDGAPLANAPSAAAGGVFVGAATPRESVAKSVRSGWLASLWNRTPSAQLTPGALHNGAFGTALLGASPDGSGFAVFAVVTGDGALVQAHVQDGVDGLAPPGTIAVGDADPGVIGIAFKWSPARVLYVADARRDRVVLLHLGDDTRHFTVSRSSAFVSPWLREPVDLAAAVPEIANPRFASHTTLAGGSDLYVVNRGDGSLLRITQDGRVLARATIDIAGEGRVGAGRLRSIAVSADAQRLWLIAERAGSDESLLLEVDGFDAAGPFVVPGAARVMALQPASAAAEEATLGERIFRTAFTPATGLGPLFNADSCLACHPGPGGSSAQEIHFAQRVARMDATSGRITSLDGQGSGLAPRLATRATGQAAVAAALPRGVNVVSLRMPLALYAARPIDAIPDAVIEAQAVAKGDGIKGRVNFVTAPDGTRRVGRFGWKADIATLDQMVAEAFTHEMGVNSALAAHPQAPIKDDGRLVRGVSAYLRTLVRPSEAAP